MVKEEDYQIVAVVAKDWCYYENDRPIHNPGKMFTLIDGLIVGLLLHEDDEKLVIAHQYFKEEEKVRHTTVVSKFSISERLDFSFEDGKLHKYEIEEE